jgi:alpha-galactosidase
MRALLVLPVIASLSTLMAAQSSYAPTTRVWTVSNATMSAEFQLTPEGYFRSQRLRDSKTGDDWMVPANVSSSVIRFQIEDDWIDGQTNFELVEHHEEAVAPAGVRRVIVLRDALSRGVVTVNLEVYDGFPVLRYSVKFRNLAANAVHVKFGNMLPWVFADRGKRFSAMRVNQWSVRGKPADFEATASALDPSGRPIEVYSGAHGDQCGWLAIRDTDSRGLFAGWEFDGRARTTVRHDSADGYVQFSNGIVDLYHPLAPGAEFPVPAAFVGLYHGDWDEAGYRTQRFAEAVIAKTPPDSAAFPYIAWDSWAYQTNIDEPTLRREAELAASLGVELFTVDLGWAKGIGDWHVDRDKFPNGMRALSDYVHSLGMKFGLHFALTEADLASPVLQANPDWTSTEDNQYQGAASLCLSNAPARDWLISEGLRIIDTYNPDWILQDGENMVKNCTKATHTHDPLDSNYSNSVDGLNAVVSEIQRARPNVYWENCENGGNMMTFNMLRNYVTSITNDASGALSSRKAVYGATYPFPPRYTDRYMPDEGVNSYVTNSYLFGGPWVIMRPLATLNAADKEFLAQKIQGYKAKRREIARGKVFHSAVPGPAATDALQSYDSVSDSSVSVITRAQSAADSYLLKPRGLTNSQRYRVWFDHDSRSLNQTGAQIMNGGISVSLPNPFTSEVVHIDKLIP